MKLLLMLLVLWVAFLEDLMRTQQLLIEAFSRVLLVLLFLKEFFKSDKYYWRYGFQSSNV